MDMLSVCAGSLSGCFDVFGMNQGGTKRVQLHITCTDTDAGSMEETKNCV
jgi:hypothetical protein